MRYRVLNLTRNTTLADRARLADTFGARLVGLLGSSHLAPGDGLIIEPCASVHTFFMRLTIDVIFVDARDVVIDVAHALPPWRTSRYYPGGRRVIELPAGLASASLTQAGDALDVKAVDGL